MKIIMKTMAFMALTATCLSTPTIAGDNSQATHIDAQYSGYLGPLKVIDVNLKTIWDNGSYRSSARMKSTGFAALFGNFDTSVNVTGYNKTTGLRPAVFQHTHTGKKTRSTQVEWKSDTVVAKANPEHGNMGHPPATMAQMLEATDTLTILAELTKPGVDLKQACSKTYKAFDGKQRYNLIMSPVGPAEITHSITPAVQGKGYKCQLRYKEIAGFKKKDKPKTRDEKFARPITVWIAEIPNRDQRVIARFQSDLGIFSATVKLKTLNITQP